MSTELDIKPTYLHEQFGNAVQLASQANNNNAVNGIQTGPAGLCGRAIDAGLNLGAPEPTSGVSELFGACKNLVFEVGQHMTPNVQAKLYPVQPTPSSAQPVVQKTTPVQNYNVQSGMRGMG